MTLTVKDSFTGQQVWAKSDEGILKVSSIAALGSQFACTMQAASSAAAPSGTNEVKTNSTGWRLVRFRARTPPTAPNVIIVGYSTTYNDTLVPTNVSARIAGDVAGATEYPNQVVMTSLIPTVDIAWDGETPIKTFAISHSTTSTLKVDVEMVYAD